MTEKELLLLAEAHGFRPALIKPEDVPVDAKFRVYCEQNLCGNYNANYSCPPDCGPVEALRQNILAEERVLIVQTIWDIAGYEDKETVHKAKKAHNQMVLRLKAEMEKQGYYGFCSGYNGCPLCEPCLRRQNLPCRHPDQRISCMSAYCIDVAKLAERCGLELAWSSEHLYLFGMLAFHNDKK